MPQVTLRAVAALAAFLVGLAAVWLSGLGARLEADVADWLVPTSDINVPATPLIERKAAVQEVYETVLREMFGGKSKDVLPVIQPETIVYSLRPKAEVTFDGAAAETLKDFNVNNKIPGALPPLDCCVRRHVILGNNELEQIFGDRAVDGWKVFDKRFPGASGYITFSAVGFNREYDEAFLYAARNCGWLCGDGWYVLLKKTERGWEIEKKQHIWTS